MVVAVWTTSQLVHPSLAEGMGFILPMYVVPVLGLAIVAAAGAYGCLSALRWVSMLVTIVLSCGVFTLFADRRRDR